jgi:hypothetical protein
MQKTSVFSDFYYLPNKLPEPKTMSWVTFQSSLRDFSDGACRPRTPSWAKFSRPCGTECKFPVFTQTLKPRSRPLSSQLRLHGWPKQNFADEGGGSLSHQHRYHLGDIVGLDHSGWILGTAAPSEMGVDRTWSDD